MSRGSASSEIGSGELRKYYSLLSAHHSRERKDLWG
jgi:hypothetical protein